MRPVRWSGCGQRCPRASPGPLAAPATMPDVTGLDDTAQTRRVLLRVRDQLHRGSPGDAAAAVDDALSYFSEDTDGPDLEEPAGEPDPDDTETKAGGVSKGKSKRSPAVAGLALVAADTGRVLMLQRALDNAKDPAAGKWEFPGGHVEDDDHTDLHGAMREWAEEVGQPVPVGGTIQHYWTSANGVYRGYVVVVPTEDALDLDAKRTTKNPDDDSEQVAWWSPDDARRNPALRPECRKSPWTAIRASPQRAEAKGIPVFEVEVKEQKPGGERVANTGAPKASAASVAGSGAAASTIPEKGSGKKRKVASKAGEQRYGLPIGTELGKARDEKAKGVQNDPAAKGLYDKLRGTNPREYRAMLDKLSDGDLDKLSAYLYSGRSSDPAVVQARIAVAGALKRRGRDVNDHGGLGKAKAPAKGRAPAKSKGTVKAPADATWLPGESMLARKARRAKLGLSGKGKPPGARTKRGEGGRSMTLHVYEDGSWQYKGIDPGRAVEPEGWVLVTTTGYDPYADVEGKEFPWQKGKGDDEDEDPPGKGDPEADDDEDDEGSDAPDDEDDEDEDDEDEDEDGKGEGNLAPPFKRKGEEKSARTTTKPSKTRTAQRAGQTIGKAKSNDPDGGDEYPIKTIGDVAAALKRAQRIKDPDRKKEVMAHIRKGAGKINAGHMVPKTDDADKGTGKGGSGKDGPPEFIKRKMRGKSAQDAMDSVDYADYIERKVMSPDPGATKLREYWAHGEGRAKWRPGSPGDFERLRKQVRKYIPEHMLNGFVANVHKLATGEWPGKKAHGKSLDVDLSGLESGDVIGADEVKAALALDADTDAGEAGDPGDPMGADAVTLALDSYSDMESTLTSSEEYAESLASQIDWDMLPDGTLTESSWEPERGSAPPPVEHDDSEPFDPMAMIDELD